MRITLLFCAFFAAASAFGGFYRVEDRGERGWWVVDPEGKDTFILGVDHVKYEGHWCEKLKRFPHLDRMKAKFPDKEDWRKETIARLTDWGFNMLGADGRFYGGRTSSPRCRGMWYGMMSDGPHPDALFGLAETPVTIAPGETRPVGDVWMALEVR